MKKIDLDRLFALPNVIGVGRGLKEVKGITKGKEAIVVLVKKKLPANQLRREELVPKIINGYQSDVIEVGEIQAYAQDLRTSVLRPASPGVSIGHYRGGAGTFGAVVYEEKSGAPLILSNNHVLANSSNGWDLRARIGDSIVQPGAPDGGRANAFATLYKYVALREFPLANTMDCALGKPLNERWVVPEILGIGKVQGKTHPHVGMNVQKSGRTTGLTTGYIRALDVTLNVSYGILRTLRFTNQILTTNMSSPGDSGSLVLDLQNRAVGLLFAGSEQATVVNPIAPILNALNVRF